MSFPLLINLEFLIAALLGELGSGTAAVLQALCPVDVLAV